LDHFIFRKKSRERRERAHLGVDELNVSVRFFFGIKRKAGVDNFNKL